MRRISERTFTYSIVDADLATSGEFRTVGMDAIADDEPFTLAELDAYVAAGHSWVALDGAARVVGYVVVDVVDGDTHIEQVSVSLMHRVRVSGER